MDNNSKTVKVKGGGTATLTTNSDGSTSISFSNNVGGGYGGTTSTYTPSSGGSGGGWSGDNADKISKMTGTSVLSPTNNNGGDTKKNVFGLDTLDISGLAFGQGTSDSDQNSRNDTLGKFFSDKDISYDNIMTTLETNVNFKNASDTDKANTVNKIMNLANKYKNNGGGGGGGDGIKDDDKQTPDYPVPDYPSKDKFDIDLSGIQGFLNQMNGDLSGLKDLVTQSNSMFLSKLDAQMTQQKAMEDKFNTEWSKIEWQMDENTRAQKERLDQMEQTYNANLAKMQDMLTDYYTGTMDALEAKKAGESAAAASDLSGKGLNQAVVANTQAGLDKNYREQFNSLMQANIELGQQLNNDYADFMQQIFNNHDTLDSNQIKFLQDGLKMKQEYRQKETDLVNSYVDNVYAPLENYYNTLTNTYTEEANTAYTKERQVAEYKAMSDDAKEKAIFDRLVSMVGTDIESLSNWDLNLIEQVAANKNITNISQAIAAIIKGASSNTNSDIYNTVKTSVSNGTWNANPDSINNSGGNNTETEGSEGEDVEDVNIADTDLDNSVLKSLNLKITNNKWIEDEVNNLIRQGNTSEYTSARLIELANKLQTDIKTIGREYEKETDPEKKQDLLKLQNMYSKSLNRIGIGGDLRSQITTWSSSGIGDSGDMKKYFIDDNMLEDEKNKIIKYIGKDKVKKINNAKNENLKALQMLIDYEKNNRDKISGTNRQNLSYQIKKRYEYNKWIDNQLALVS